MSDDILQRIKLESEESYQRARRNHIWLQALNAAAALKAIFPPDADDTAWHPVGPGGERLTAARVRRWIDILERINP